MSKPTVKVPAGSSKSGPSMAFFHNESSPFLASWNPQLREQREDVRRSWKKSASRVIDALHNSGFVTKIFEVASASTIGPGLKFSSRPNATALGWTEDEAKEFGKALEDEFSSWADNPEECDASGQMTFAQLQQAHYASWQAYGEGLSMAPKINRPGSRYVSKVFMLPPSRIVDKTSPHDKIYNGIKLDEWGKPQSIYIREGGDVYTSLREKEFNFHANDGSLAVKHTKNPGLMTTRGISELAPVMKVYRQAQQFADANHTQKLMQTIFAATMKSNLGGIGAFEGLMTNGDTGAIKLDEYAKKKGEWYDGAAIDLSDHGRIAQLMPGDELEMVQAAKTSGEFDISFSWLLRELCACAGVMYENGSGDYRGATYSSIRMGGAIEWLSVLRKRVNICIPFAQWCLEMAVEEAVATGKVKYKGGYAAFLEQKHHALRGTWTGPARPQADEFKTARSQEVLKGMNATTLLSIRSEYGEDWDDMMRQQARENALAEELGLPLPWSPIDLLETSEGLNAQLNAPANDVKDDKKNKPARRKTKGGVRNNGDNQNRDASKNKDPVTAIDKEADTDAQLEKELKEDLGE